MNLNCNWLLNLENLGLYLMTYLYVIPKEISEGDQTLLISPLTMFLNFRYFPNESTWSIEIDYGISKFRNHRINYDLWRLVRYFLRREIENFFYIILNYWVMLLIFSKRVSWTYAFPKFGSFFSNKNNLNTIILKSFLNINYRFSLISVVKWSCGIAAQI